MHCSIIIIIVIMLFQSSNVTKRNFRISQSLYMSVRQLLFDLVLYCDLCWFCVVMVVEVVSLLL